MVDWTILLATSYFGNTVKQYFVAAGIFLITLFVLRLFKSHIIGAIEKAAKKTKTKLDDIIISAIDDIPWMFYILASLIIGLKSLTLPATADKWIGYIVFIVVVFYFVRAIQRLITHFAEIKAEARQKDDKTEDTTLITLLAKIANIGIWIIAALFIISNMGIEITPFVASLGVGGLAVAFAFQNILEDLFSSFTIYFDKPFKKGDYIVIGTDSGIVNNVGLKSTRLTTLQGEELIVSNRELTQTRINNYKRMKKRRIVFHLGVEYGTPSKKLKKINQIVEKIFKKHKDADLDRVHFTEFGDFSLNYEIVYFCKFSDYAKFRDLQECINFDIKDAFEKEKIEMAFPTQTIFVKK